MQKWDTPHLRSHARRRRTPHWILALLAACWASTALAADAKPRRIVSLNLCADQYLLLLSDRKRIASITHLAARPEFSPYAARAHGLPANRGQAEEIVTLKPDLVLAGRFSARATVSILRRLGYRVVDVPVVTEMAGIRRNIRLVAKAIGEPERGETAVLAFDRRLNEFSPPPGTRRPLAAVYWIRGRTAGAGTLIAAIVEAAGFDNLALRLGMRSYASLPLEILLTRRVDAVILANTAGVPPALATQSLGHPAISRLISSRPSISLNSQGWLCGTPDILGTIERLAKLRRRIVGR